MTIVFERQAIPDVILIKPKLHKDERGFFMESYKQSLYNSNGITDVFVQDNAARSKKGVVRGLHYQLQPKANAKLVSVTKGALLDVAVDIRQGSPSYGKWVSALLTEENRHQLYVPIGFAHGYRTLSEEVEISYKVSEEYAPDYDRGIFWNDPDLAIDWGIEQPLLSDKDQQQPLLKKADNNFSYGENS